MEASEILKNISEYRKKHWRKCVSTTHRMTMDEFLVVAKRLKGRYKKFAMEVKNGGCEVRIGMPPFL